MSGVVPYWEFVSTDAKRRGAGEDEGRARAWVSGGEGMSVVALNLEFVTVRCEEVR